TDCDGCHRRAFGPAVGPHQVSGPYPVAGAFSHAEHLARLAANRGGRPCLVCHAEVTRTSGERVPAPAMTTCEACHDGAAAFATLGTECRRCHPEPPATRLELPRERARFSHEQHAAAGVELGCDACHA